MEASLILFPVPIGSEVNIAIPEYNRELLNTCRTFIVEDVRTARRNLKRMGYTAAPIDEVTFWELNEHTQATDIVTYLDPIAKGENVGLMSEAGLPCVADPGNMITSMAQSSGINVIPLVGPSSIMLALMASGFNGQNFAFLGYPPIDVSKRTAFFKKVEQAIYRDNQTQILIEAPYRNDKLLEYMARNLQVTTRICVATDLTMESQFVKTKISRQWLSNPPELHKRPTIFILYK